MQYNVKSSFNYYVESLSLQGVNVHFDANVETLAPCIIFDYQFIENTSINFVKNLVCVVDVLARDDRERESILTVLRTGFNLSHTGKELDLYDYLTDPDNPVDLEKQYWVKLRSEPRYIPEPSLAGIKRAQFEINLMYSEI